MSTFFVNFFTFLKSSHTFDFISIELSGLPQSGIISSFEQLIKEFIRFLFQDFLNSQEIEN